MEYTAGRGTTALGIIGTVLGGTALAGNGVLGNLLGGANAAPAACMDSNNMPINRYDMGLIRDNMAKDAEISLLKADTYTNQKIAEMNDRYNARFTNIEAELAKQAIHNQKTEDSFVLAQADLRAVRHHGKRHRHDQGSPGYGQRQNQGHDRPVRCRCGLLGTGVRHDLGIADSASKGRLRYAAAAGSTGDESALLPGSFGKHEYFGILVSAVRLAHADDVHLERSAAVDNGQTAEIRGDYYGNQN